ncbi:30S ribosomal protein S27ae [ANME-1 cluster archaeon GoMg1]|nr:30S ribosomal protein S27ae [ANME-1 cluster archaeon GoMg1]
MTAIHKFYEVVEEKGKGKAKGGWKLKRKRKTCPRCGAGVFLAEHKDRYACGKCGYTEFIKAKKS